MKTLTKLLSGLSLAVLWMVSSASAQTAELGAVHCLCVLYFLHASSACIVPMPRRVVHLEFAAEELPGGLKWHDRV